MIDAEICLAHLTELGLVPDDAVAIFCVGSVARGWANETSDHNFYVISATPWSRPGVACKVAPLDPPSVPVHVLHLDGRCWKLKHWSQGQVDQMLAKVGWDRFPGRAGGDVPLAEIEELFVERLESGVPVTGAAWLDRHRQRARASAFRAFITVRSLDAAAGCLRDARDRLAVGDTHGAVLNARRGFGFMVDALLDSRGIHGIFTPKWRARRFRELSPSSLTFDEYWGLETMAGFTPDRPEVWVHTVLEACRRIEAEIGDVRPPAEAGRAVRP